MGSSSRFSLQTKVIIVLVVLLIIYVAFVFLSPESSPIYRLSDTCFCFGLPVFLFCLFRTVASMGVFKALSFAKYRRSHKNDPNAFANTTDGFFEFYRSKYGSLKFDKFLYSISLLCLVLSALLALV